MTTRTAPAPASLILAIFAAVALLAACGGGSTDSAETPAGNEPTEAAPNDGSGVDKVDLDPSKGTVHAEVTGDKTLTIELGFVPPTSHFETNGDNSAYLTFTNSDATEALFVNISDGSIIVQYAGDAFGLPLIGAGGCTSQVDELDDSHAKGSFTCPGMQVFEGDNASVTGTADLSGTFEARK